MTSPDHTSISPPPQKSPQVERDSRPLSFKVLIVLTDWQMPVTRPSPGCVRSGLPRGEGDFLSCSRALPHRCPHFLLQPQRQLFGSTSCGNACKQQENKPAEVVLGDTPNPSLQEKGPLGSENNDCSCPSACYLTFLAPSTMSTLWSFFHMESHSMGFSAVSPLGLVPGGPLSSVPPPTAEDPLGVSFFPTCRVSCQQQGISICCSVRFKDLHSQSFCMLTCL